MSVQFQKHNFTISIPTGTNPAEDWLETTDELIDVLQCCDPDLSLGKSHGKVLEILRHLLPDLETAKKMTLET